MNERTKKGFGVLAASSGSASPFSKSNIFKREKDSYL